MGNEVSQGQKQALNDFAGLSPVRYGTAAKKKKKSKKVQLSWEEAAKALISAVPLWAEGQLGKQRFIVPCNKKKVMDNVFILLANEVHEHEGGNIKLNSRKSRLLLSVLERALTSKALYKLLDTESVGTLVSCCKVARKQRRFQLLEHTLIVLRMVTERVGEQDADKKDKLESNAKELFVAAGGLQTIMELLDVDLDDNILAEAVELLLAFVTTHQSSGTWEAVHEIVDCVVTSHLPALWELSRSFTLRLRAASSKLLAAVLLEGNTSQAGAIQRSARNYGALLWHLNFAVEPALGSKDLAAGVPPPVMTGHFATKWDEEIQMWSRQPQWDETDASCRKLSRLLVALLCAHQPDSVAIVKRMLPGPMHCMLNQAGKGRGPAPSDLLWDFVRPCKPKTKAAKAAAAAKTKAVWYQISPGVKIGAANTPKETWAGLWDGIREAHRTPTLLWTETSMWELRAGLWKDITALDIQRRTVVSELLRGKSSLVEHVKNKRRESIARRNSEGGMADAKAEEEEGDGQRERLPSETGIVDVDDVTPGIEEDDDIAPPETESQHALRERQRMMALSIDWDWSSFEITYDSLDSDLFVSGFYVSTLVPVLRECYARPGTSPVTNHAEFVRSLAEQFFVEDNPSRKLMCLQAMRMVIHDSPASFTNFSRLPFVVKTLAMLSGKVRKAATSQRDDEEGSRIDVGKGSEVWWARLWRDELMEILELLLQSKDNAREFGLCGGLEALTPLLLQRTTPGEDTKQLSRRPSVLLGERPVQSPGGAVGSSLVLEATAVAEPLATLAEGDEDSDSDADSDAKAAEASTEAAAESSTEASAEAAAEAEAEASTEAGVEASTEAVAGADADESAEVSASTTEEEGDGTSDAAEAEAEASTEAEAEPTAEAEAEAEAEVEAEAKAEVEAEAAKAPASGAGEGAGAGAAQGEGEAVAAEPLKQAVQADASEAIVIPLGVDEKTEPWKPLDVAIHAADILHVALTAWPRLSLQLCTEGLLQTLLSSLLQDSSAIGAAVLRLLTFILPRAPLYYEVLQKHAFFRIVLYTATYIGEGSAELQPDAAALLYGLHNVEVKNASTLHQAASLSHGDALGTGRQSYLDGLLPPSMITILRNEGPEEFAEVFNSALHASPAALWYESMRNRLFKALHAQLGAWSTWVAGGALPPKVSEGAAAVAVGHSFGDVVAGTVFMVPGLGAVPGVVPILYPELEREPRVSGVYLRVYSAGADCSVEPVSFLADLVSELVLTTAAFITAFHAIRASDDVLAAVQDSPQYMINHHKLTMLLLSLQRLLTDVRGAQLTGDSQACLFMLLGLFKGEAPAASDPAVIDVMEEHDGAADPRPTLITSPLALTLLMPPPPEDDGEDIAWCGWQAFTSAEDATKFRHTVAEHSVLSQVLNLIIVAGLHSDEALNEVVDLMAFLVGPTAFNGSHEEVSLADDVDDGAGEEGGVVAPTIPYEEDSKPAPPSSSITRMEAARRTLLWAASPVLARAVVVFDLVARAEAQLQLFTNHPAWVLMLLRACQVHWDDALVPLEEGQAAADGNDDAAAWVVPTACAALAWQQVAARGLCVLAHLSHAAAVRSILVEAGALPQMLAVAAGGEATFLQLKLSSHDDTAEALADTCKADESEAAAAVATLTPHVSSRELRDSQRPRASFIMAAIRQRNEGQTPLEALQLRQKKAAAQAAAAEEASAAPGSGSGAGAGAGSATAKAAGITMEQCMTEPEAWVAELSVRQAAGYVLQELSGAVDAKNRVTGQSPEVTMLVKTSLRQMMTPGLLRKLCENKLLPTLLTARRVETPIVIWSPVMRKRLLWLCSSQSEKVTLGASYYMMRYGRASGYAAMQHPLQLWQAPGIATPGLFRDIYPSLEREVLVEDVWVRLYVKFPAVTTLDPPPEIVMSGMFEDVDMVRHESHGYADLEEQHLDHLSRTLPAMGVLLKRLPGLWDASAHNELLSSVTVLLQHFVSWHRKAFATDAAAGDEEAREHEKLWRVILSGVLNTCASLAETTKGGKVLAAQLHSLHLILRNEVAAQAKVSVPSDRTEAVDRGDDLLESVDVLNGVLEVIKHATRTFPPLRNSLLRSGVLVSCLAIAQNVFTQHPAFVRESAVQVIAAAAGVAPSTPEGELLHTSAAEADAASLFSTSPRAAAGAGAGAAGEDAEAAALAAKWGKGEFERSVAKWLHTIMWPLFDNALRGVGLLHNSWEEPEAVITAYETNQMEPHLVWTAAVRDDIKALLHKDWSHMSDWFSGHPHNEYLYDFEGVEGRLPRDAISLHLLVGDIFVYNFNRKPFFKAMIPEEFIVALFDHQHAHLADVCPPLATDVAVKDAEACWEAIGNVIEANPRLADMFVEKLSVALRYFNLKSDARAQVAALKIVKQLARVDSVGKYFVECKALAVPHLLSLFVSLEGVAGNADTAGPPPLVDMMATLTDMSRRSNDLVPALVACGAVSFLLQRILRAKDSPADRQVAIAAATLLSTMGTDDDHSELVRRTTYALVGERFAEAFEMKAAGLIAFALEDAEGWDSAARAAAAEILAEHRKKIAASSWLVDWDGETSLVPVAAVEVEAEEDSKGAEPDDAKTAEEDYAAAAGTAEAEGDAEGDGDFTPDNTAPINDPSDEVEQTDGADAADEPAAAADSSDDDDA